MYDIWNNIAYKVLFNIFLAISEVAYTYEYIKLCKGNKMTTVNTLKTVFLITLMTVLLVFIGNLIGGRTGMIIALVFAVGIFLILV